MINCKETLNYQENLYFIKRKIKESRINPELIDSLKNYLECDLVLKQNNNGDSHYLFLVLIPIVEILEHIPK
jgi:hypothetical protein